MKNKTSIKNYSICLVFFISIFSFNAFAQEHGIFELKLKNEKAKANKTTLSTSKKTKPANKAREDFNNLAYKLHPTVYVENGIEKKIYGDGTIIKMTLEDANSIKSLNSLMSKYSKVKLLTINLNSINDLNITCNLGSIPNTSNLKYVFIKGRFSCDEARLNKFINRGTPNIRVFYLCEGAE